MLPSPPKPTKSPALLKILQEAQNKLDAQEYDRMTRSVRHQTHQSFSNDLSDVKFLTGQLSAILNVFLSMVAVFVAVMYFGDQVFSDLSWVIYFFLRIRRNRIFSKMKG